MADDQGVSNSPSPLGGAALRQARRRDPYLFSGPRQTVDNAPGLWTQFSGMPNQPGSPTSLHEWLQSVDDAVLASDAGPGTQGFPASSSSAASSRNSPLDTYTAADFLSPGIGQDRTVSASPSSDMGHCFDFSSQSSFGSSPDFGSPADYATLHSSQFPSSPASHMPSLSADMSRLPPADFSQPPPDFSFRSHHDFSQPPPSYVPLSPFSPAADPHLGFSDFLTSQSNSNYPTGDAAVQRVRHHSVDFSHFEHTNRSSEPLPSHHNTNTSSHPAFSDFSSVADDIFQGSVSTETSNQNGISDFERATSPHRKVQRQNSEPMFGGAAADEGKAMYMEAFRRLNSLGPAGSSYEQFGSTVRSTVQPHSENTEKVHTAVDSPSANVSKPTKAKELPSKDPTKLSYSDVARASKGKSSHHTDSVANEKSEPERDSVVKNYTEPSQSKPHRHQTTRRAFTHTRIINQRSKGGVSDSSQNTYIQPNSRYGLDQFEDLSDLVGAELRSSSVESLNSQPQQGGARRNSNSSLSSSTSAVEEGHGSKMSSTCVGAGINTAGSRDSSGKDTSHDSVYNNTSHGSSSSGSGPTQHKASSSTSQPAAPTTKGEKLFFDPKRIFQNTTKAQSNLTNKTKTTEEKGRSERESAIKEEIVLNNGKPNNTSSKASASSHRKTDYINNDLREGSSAGSSTGGGGASKRTNQTAAFNRHGHGSRKNSAKDTLPQNGSGTDRSRGGDVRGRRQEPENEDDNSFIRNIDWVLVDEWMKYISDCSMTFARNSFSAILTLVVYILGFIMYLAMGAIHLIAVGIGKLWALIKSRVFKDQTSGPWSGFTPGADSARKRFGLEENITLPSTGEEAMKRLLACKGKDPYSILGLRADASDEEIKRYYRRQAVLVHPDKNQEPGAEEAFKILGHAFEMIGEPTKRKEYDAHIFEASEAEAAMREFSDLLTKLQEKVQEAANMMRCDHCGGKHRRVPVDRAWYSARFCDRCNIHHSAKEGDVWAESSMLGFLWHYYACMDNNIYDITDWVSCQRENFKHMKANAHPVYYRIQTDSSRRHRQGQSGEADLEDFINRLFNKASMSPDGASHPNWQFPSQQSSGGGSQSSWGAASSSNSSSSSSKRSRRKKKRN